jgi:HEPN domain-containing protein
MVENMDANEKYEYWLHFAKESLLGAKGLINVGARLFSAYACQQAIEKLSKGLYVLYIDDNVPYIHDISKIIKVFESKLPVEISEERYLFFNKLSMYCIEGRYPDYKKKLSDGLTKKEAKNLLTQTTEAFSWLLTLKP